MRIETPHAKPTAVYLGLTVGVAAISFAATLIRLAEAPFLVIAAFRMGLASLVLVPTAIVHTRGRLPHTNRRELMLTTASAVCLALHFAFWIASLSYTSVVLVTTSPIMVAFVSHFLVKERVTRNVVLGVGLAFAGSLVLGWGDLRIGTGEHYGDFLAFLGAIAAAGYLLLGRQVRSRMSPLPYIALVYAGAAVLLLASVTVAGDSFVGYSAKIYLMLVLVALVPQVLGHSSLNGGTSVLPWWPSR